MEYVQDSTLSGFSDVSYFFGEAGKSLKVRHTMYPDKRFIEKCAMERDFGDATEAVLDMWSNVKGDNLNPGILIIYFRMFQCPVCPWAIQQVQEKTPPAEYPSVEKQKEEGVTPLPVYANDSTNTCAVSTRKNMVKGYTVA